LSGPADVRFGHETRVTSMVTDIAERVRKIIVMHLAAEETRITEDAKFIGDLGADSLDVFEVTMSFEEEFDIQIPDRAVEHLVTVGDAIAFIRAKAV
jgi:acyl carrier protein